MAQESGSERARERPLATRCPYCHTDVERAQEEWVACQACLAPHHRGCWSEAGECASCGEPRAVGDGAPLEAGPAPRRRQAPGTREKGEPQPVAPAEVAAVLELELRGRRAHFEGGAELRAPLQPGVDERLLVRVRNDTAEAQRVELRELPGWLVAEAPGGVEVAPGSTADLWLVVRAVAAPGLSEREPRGASFAVSTGTDARTVRLVVEMAPEVVGRRQRRRLLLAAVLGLLVLIYGSFLTRLRHDRADQLALRGIQVQAVVTEVQRWNHNRLVSEYVVDGVRYPWLEHHRGGQVGDSFELTVLPDQPEVVVRGRAYETYTPPGIYAPPLAALLIGTCGLLASVLIPRATRRSEPPSA
ncbi:MAG: RING finger protein [Planctomycetota bacterium]